MSQCSPAAYSRIGILSGTKDIDRAIARRRVQAYRSLSLRSWIRADLSMKEPMATILILDDRAVDRTFLATLPKSAGHVVNKASN